MKNTSPNKFKYFSFIFFVCLFFQATQAQTTFTGKPRYQILTTQNSATLGIINIELFPNIAPYHVRNFDSLVSTLFYDTTAFHRVVPGFVIQGGDPNTRSGPVNTWGYGQPGQPTVKAEFSVAKHERGILSAARSSNINSATSQFFICVAPAPSLNGNYSIYGRVTSGMNFVDQIVTTPTVLGTQRPVQKVEMFVTYIGSNDTIPLAPVLIGPRNDSTEVDTNVVKLKWNKVPDGIIYTLTVSHDSLFTDTVKNISLAQLDYNLLFLPAKTKYYWKVQVNNGGHSTDSPIWHFTTAPKEEEVVNTTGLLALAKSGERVVFPNPTRDKFTFSNVNYGEKIEITDLSGRLIYSTVAHEKNVTINFADKARGTYLYHIWDGQNKITEGKIVIDN